MEQTIRAYLNEAILYADAGIKPTKEPNEAMELPQDLIAALDADIELAGAFYRLTPGRRRSYVFNLNSVKNSNTRMARIAKFRAHIVAGKGAMER